MKKLESGATAPRERIKIEIPRESYTDEPEAQAQAVARYVIGAPRCICCGGLAYEVNHA